MIFGRKKLGFARNQMTLAKNEFGRKEAWMC